MYNIFLFMQARTVTEHTLELLMTVVHVLQEGTVQERQIEFGVDTVKLDIGVGKELVKKHPQMV